MDPKIYSLYDNLVKFGHENTNSTIPYFFEKILSTDYNSALSVWEYLLIKNEKKLDDEFLTKTLIVDIFRVLKHKNLVKTNKAVSENPIFSKALFLNSAAIKDEAVLDFPVTLIMQGKFDLADNVFKLICKNPYIDYGTTLREIFEYYFAIVFEKNSDKNIIKINRKTADFFMIYINKIKGSEKALLTQRINEIK